MYGSFQNVGCEVVRSALSAAADHGPTIIQCPDATHHPAKDCHAQIPSCRWSFGSIHRWLCTPDDGTGEILRQKQLVGINGRWLPMDAGLDAESLKAAEVDVPPAIVIFATPVVAMPISRAV